MGQPSSPTIYQQPSKSEQDANKLANQQKEAALAKLNQSIYGESKGLRGMGGLYEWAGPTPWLAANMGPQSPKGKPAKDPNVTGPYGVPPNTPGGAGSWTTGPGHVPTPPGTVPGYVGSQGPPGDRNAPTTVPMVYGSGRGPYGDRGAPGWQPAAPMGGPRGEARTVPSGPSPIQQATTTKLFQAAGLPAPTFKQPPNVPPTTQQYAQKVAQQTGLVPTAKPVAVPPPPAAPKAPPAVLQQLGITPKTAAPAQPAAPAPAPAPAPPKAPAPAPVPAPVAAPVMPIKATATVPQIVAQATIKPSIYQTPRTVNTGGGRR